MSITRLVCLLTFLTASSLYAQKSLIYPSPNSLESVEEVSLPLQNNALLQKEAQSKDLPNLTFAKKIYKSIDCANEGTWESLPNDMSMWRIRISSPNASSLNLAFDKYIIPEGGNLIIYNTDLDYVLGPFTHFDNKSHGRLWSPIMPFDEIILELKIPTILIDELQLEVGEINHGFGSEIAKSFSQSCHLDVVCGLADGYGEVEKYREAIKSVGVYSIDGTRLCTGALINNTKNDCKPYFLSADHCGVSASNQSSVVIYWNFENSTCRTPGSVESGSSGNGQLNIFNTGVKVVASSPVTDFALFELDQDVPVEADPYYAGWNITGVNTDTVACIHHPSVDEKRISFDYNTVGIYDQDENYWIVNNWEVGSTESGSSGAPLFNNDGEIIGQIFGGMASCSNNLWDIFGRLDLAWEGDGDPTSRLKDWLDPSDEGIKRIGGRGCSALLNINESTVSVCNNVQADYAVILSVNNGFSNQANLTFENPNEGIVVSLERSTITENSTSIANISIAPQVPSGTYEVKFRASEGSTDALVFLTIIVSKGFPEEISPIAPTSIRTVGTTFEFEWVDDYELYDFQLSTSPNFNMLLANEPSLMSSNYTGDKLENETKYYWRVRGVNACGTGPWSIFEFETGKIVCTSYTADDLPIAIDEQDMNTIISRINVVKNEYVTDVNVLNINGKHSFISDLQFRLISPAGSEVILLNRECDADSDFDIGFDDASDLNTSCPITDKRVYKPAFPLSVFIDEESLGAWQLQINDTEEFDGGTLNEWTLEICTNVSEVISSTEDLIEEVISTFPNPVNDILQVRLNSRMKYPNFSIIDVAGSTRLSGELESSIDVSSLSNGIYFLQLRDAEKILGIKKLVITK